MCGTLSNENIAEIYINSWWLLIVGVPLVGNLRTRLLALHVLEAVLPACESNMEDDQMTQVRLLCFVQILNNRLFSVSELI